MAADADRNLTRGKKIRKMVFVSVKRPDLFNTRMEIDMNYEQTMTLKEVEYYLIEGSLMIPAFHPSWLVPQSRLLSSSRHCFDREKGASGSLSMGCAHCVGGPDLIRQSSS